YTKLGMTGAFSPPTYVDFRSQLKSFETLSATTPWNANLTGSGKPERVDGLLVSPQFFQTLGVTPIRGRNFLPEEEQKGKDKVVVISEALWRTHFAANESLIGHSIQLNDTPYEIIGIMPPGFRWGRSYGRETLADVWAPFAITPDMLVADQRGNEY